MIEQIMYNKFKKLTERKQIDYLYTAFVEQDQDKLNKAYGPKEVSVTIEDDVVIIDAPTLKDARNIRDNMLMNGMILVDEDVFTFEDEDGVCVEYAFEGNVQPICLN